MFLLMNQTYPLFEVIGVEGAHASSIPGGKDLAYFADDIEWHRATNHNARPWLVRVISGHSYDVDYDRMYTTMGDKILSPDSYTNFALVATLPSATVHSGVASK